MNIYVANFSFEMEDHDLKQLFIPFGEILSVKIARDKSTKRSRGFGFVELGSAEAGLAAIAAMNNKEVNGRHLSVAPAKQKVQGPVQSVWM
ncbi:MAG: RNA-binding protein, partial [Chitinophagaceae bacterium]|nr:RNA-binding protein [Chitinophagaceae bacterium]